MKKLLAIIMAAAIITTPTAALGASSAFDTRISPVILASPDQSITLDQTEVTIVRTQKIALTPSFALDTASRSVKWTSSNKSVATVSPKGIVTGKKAGTAVITCTAKDGSGASASCTVTVLPIDPAGIRISKTAVTLKPNKRVQLKATVSPKNADNKAVTWTSDNPAVATVTAKGMVRAVGEGAATITATTANGLTASCAVTVSMIYPTGIRISKTALTLKQGKTATLKAAVLPKNTDFKAVTWTSDNPAVATVTAKGKVKAVSPGTAAITASTANGIAASCTVTVSGAACASIKVIPETVSITVGQSVTLAVKTNPANAPVTWSSDNPGIAYTDSNGMIWANAAGTATVTATSNGKSATCVVTVNPKPAPDYSNDTYTYLDSAYEQAVCDGVNWTRQNNGTAPTSILVTLNANLTAQAREHAMKMAVAHDIFHSGLGYAESVAVGYFASDGFGAGGMSAVHAGSLVDPNVTLLGVGAVQTSDGTVYLCVMGTHVN